MELELIDESDTRSTRNVPTSGSLCLALQGADVATITRSEVWREDVLVIDGTRYLVLNLGMMERRAPGTINDEVNGLRPAAFWSPSGRAVLELQAMDENGNGLAEPTMIECELPDDGDKRFVVSLMQCTLLPVSPRRP